MLKNKDGHYEDLANLSILRKLAMSEEYQSIKKDPQDYLRKPA